MIRERERERERVGDGPTNGLFSEPECSEGSECRLPNGERHKGQFASNVRNGKSS